MDEPVVEHLRVRLSVLEAVLAVSDQSSLELDQALDHVDRQVAACLPCDRAAVYLWGDDGLALAHLFATGERPWRDDGSVSAALLARRAPVVIEDTGGAPFLDGPWAAASGARCVLAQPLGQAGSEIGVLVAARTRVLAFRDGQRQVAAAIARHATIVIGNAQRYDRQQAEITALEERSRASADHVTGLVHDLRTPLTGVVGLVRLLQDLGERADPRERAAHLATIARQSERMAGMVDDILLAARGDAGVLVPDEVAPVVLADLLPPALDAYTADARARVAQRVEEPGVVVRGDAAQLLRVVQNLLDNALRYAPLGEPVLVRVGRAGDDAVLEVSDRGGGIPAEQVPFVFDRFSAGRRPGSTGLGLYVVRQVVDRHGGSVSVSSPAGAGTTVTVRLPAAG